MDDLTKDYLKRNAAVLQKGILKNQKKIISFNYGSMGGYNTYDEVVKQLDT